MDIKIAVISAMDEIEGNSFAISAMAEHSTSEQAERMTQLAAEMEALFEQISKQAREQDEYDQSMIDTDNYHRAILR